MREVGRVSAIYFSYFCCFRFCRRLCRQVVWLRLFIFQIRTQEYSVDCRNCMHRFDGLLNHKALKVHFFNFAKKRGNCCYYIRTSHSDLSFDLIDLCFLSETLTFLAKKNSEFSIQKMNWWSETIYFFCQSPADRSREFANIADQFFGFFR